MDDPTRHSFWLAGRRGAKTTGFREDLLLSTRNWPVETDIFYIGPTNQQAMELIWDQLTERLEQLRWKHRPLISRQRIDFSHRRKIYVIGAEKIGRVRGHKSWRVYLDELAYFNTPLDTVWKAVRPTLTDVKGRCKAGTTPDGKGSEAYDFYMAAKRKSNWSVHQWVTMDNPGIPKSELEEAMQDMDPVSFRQEYLATWETFGNLAYYTFDENEHLKPCSQFDYDYPVWLTLDFNVNPTSLLMAQEVRGHHFLRKEYSEPNSSTENTVESFCKDFQEDKRNMKIKITGDATGKARKSNTGESDYHYVEEMLTAYGYNYEMDVPKSNPPIVDRVKHTNAYFKNARKQSRVTIDPHCVDTIRDFSSQQLAGRHPSDKNNLGHKADAWGYYVHNDYENKLIAPNRQIQL